LQEGKQVFLPFPKKSQGLERCLRWVNACGRGKAFTVDHVTKHTYICCLHWPGEAGPTVEFDVPLKATLTSKEVLKASKPKRKLPRERHPVQSKRRRLCRDEPHSSQDVDEAIAAETEVTENAIQEDDLPQPKSRNFSTQTDVSKHELSYKLEAMMLRNTLSTKTRETTNILSNMSY